MGKTALITGGVSGIGAEYAKYFAGESYNLILTVHPDDPVFINTEELIRKYSISVTVIKANLALEADISMVEKLIKENSTIEVLINNAGFVFWKYFWENSVPELENMIRVHINTPLRLIYAALPGMKRNKKGLIIHVSSLSAFLPIPRDSMYSATKLFNNSLLESLHISVRDLGIKIQVMCPGFVQSNFHKRAGVDTSRVRKSWFVKWMMPEDVVRISVKNLKYKNRVIIVPGFRNKLIRFMVESVPRRFYYRFAARNLQ